VIIEGRLDSGIVKQINASQDGHLETEIHGPLSAFGEMIVTNQTPVFQHDFAYNYINPELGIANSYGSASVTASNQMLNCTTGASASSLASWRPRRIMRYRPGQGALMRFTAIYDTATTGNTQLVGFSSGESGLFFGSVDTSRGVFRTYGGVREIQTLTIGTKSSNSQNATVTLGGVAYTVPVTNGANTAATAAEIAAFDYSGSAPGWTASQLGSTVRFVCLVAGNQTGTFSVSFPTSGAGSFVETVAGVASSFDAIPQASWNVDICDGRGGLTNPSNINLDWTKGNVFYIRWQYLGFGVIEFGIEEAATGELVPVHRIQYPNANTTVSLTQPGGFFTASCRNTTNNTALTVKVGSCAGFIEGIIKRLGVQRSKTTTLASVGTSFTPILSLRGGHVYQNRINMGEVHILGISVSNNSTNRSVEYQILEQAVLNNSTNWASESVNTSIVDSDTGATSYTNGTPKFGGVVGPNGSISEMFGDGHALTLEGNNWITIVAKALAGTADVSVGIHWVEDH
jgi:hypothetical protein